MTRAAAALLLALVAAWGAALWAGFVFDDLADVVENPAGRSATFWESLGATLRPLLKASYALQDWLHGPWAPGFHAGNLLLHLAAALVALCWLTRLAGARAALVAAALWGLHPALASSVTEVAGRSAVLSGLLVLGSLALATGAASRPRLFAAGLLAFLAPLAHETALVLPLLLLWWQVTLGRDGWRAGCRRAWPVWPGALLAAAAILALPRHRELIDYSLAARAPLDALRGNLLAIPAILRFLAEPWTVTIDPAQPRPWGWGDAATLLSAGGLLGAALAALLLRRRTPLAAFALGWTLLGLMPSNSLLWREEPVGLRPLYLAGLGPALLLALVLARRRAGLVLAALLCLGLGVLTLERNRLYADPVALWQDAADKAPGKGRPRIQLGLALLDHGCLERAAAALAEGLRLDPASRAARQGLERLAALRAEAPPPACDLP
jgi:hypothetical protein